ASCRRVATVAGRSVEPHDAHQSTRSHRHERGKDDYRPPVERGHIYGAADRRSGTPVVAVEERPSRVHDREDVHDALIQRQTERRGDVRSPWVSGFVQGEMTMSRRVMFALVALSLLPISLSAQATYDRLLHAAQEPQNWLTYSGGYASLRHSLLKQIDTGNAKNLEQQWVFQVDSSLQNFEATPLVVDGVMYFTQPINDVVALDAKTGRVFWVYRHNLPNDIKPCCGSVNRGVAVLGNKVFVGTLDGQLIALD